MNPTPDTTSISGDGGYFDPRKAAALLDRTTRQTRRRIEPAQPWLLAIRGVVVLAVLGAVWLNVRAQHPYQHPTAAILPVVIAFGIVNLIATLAVAWRATAGVSGRRQLVWAEIAAVVVTWITVFAIMTVLAGTGLSDGVVYGIYPVAAPLIAGGLVLAGITAARAEWHRCASAVAVAAVGAVAIPAGPAGAWLVAGVGLCVVLLATAAVIVSRQRRSVVQP